MPSRHPPPFADRVESGRPITGDLLSAASGEPLDLAERFATTWFDAARTAAVVGAVLVFDDFVIGPPCPLLLEAAHQVRLMRRAERRGLFDDEEQQWYDEHADDDDDDDAVWERPSIPDRMLAAMEHGQESERLVHGSVVAVAVWSAFGRDRECWMPLVHLGVAMEHLLVELASAIRIGDAAVVDARLAGERMDGLGLAA
jgi:hypothetical protein